MRKPTLHRLWWLGFLGLLPLPDGRPAWNRAFLLFFFAPLAGDLVRWMRKPRRKAERPGSGLPLPAPAARGGPARFQLRYTLSSTLALLNPRQLRQVLRQARGDAAARRRARGREPAPDTYAQKVEYTLPFHGEWLVVNGGVTQESSHSWELISQRYAWDLVVAGPDGARHRGDGTRPEDYFCYGQPVLAPADGEVVAVVEGVRDAPRVGTGWVDWRAADIGGNSVTLRHAEGEYSYLAHLVPGSVRVRPGQRVRRGEQVGRCGNSGHSTEPHLHLQFQDHPDFHGAVGLPVRFSAVLSAGEDEPRTVHLRAGMRVRAAPADGR